MKKKLFAIVMASLIAFSATAFAADAEDPSDVEELEATALDGSVKLVWSAATDDIGVEGYYVHYGDKPVLLSGESYDEVLDVDNVLEYTVGDLENGTEYFFSVVAYDAAGNESAAWAPEASATPESDAGSSDDSDSPQVTEAEALYKEAVKIVFSEAIKIPETDAQDAFAVENDDTFEALEVIGVEMDDKDASGRTVILETEEQEGGATYKLTVGVYVEDIAGNPIISGTSDTAIFEGSDADAPVEDDEGPEIVGIEVVDVENVLISFNETIVVGIDPSENFEFVSKSDDSDILDVLKVTLGDNEDGIESASALVKTTMQTGSTYTLTVDGVTDEAGNEIEDGKNTIEFLGMGSGGGEDPGEDPDEDEDTDAPKDVAKLIAKKVLQAEKYLVTLSWQIPSENVGDVVEQIVYMSQHKGDSYSKEATLNPEVNEYEVGEFEPGDYWFKVTQVDGNGNESEGTIAKIVLSETGPGMLGLLVFSLGMGRVVGRKKK